MKLYTKVISCSAATNSWKTAYAFILQDHLIFNLNQLQVPITNFPYLWFIRAQNDPSKFLNVCQINFLLQL
uniref:Uncharacterized protein n=1 Tax=Arundo donax TaxID=35708 RepID=A0A0A8YJD2_ARUDO